MVDWGSGIKYVVFIGQVVEHLFERAVHLKTYIVAWPDLGVLPRLSKNLINSK